MNVIVVGAAGRMGREVLAQIKAAGDLELVAGVDPASKEFPSLEEVAGKADVVIDFSTPKSAIQAAGWCARHKTALVSGTTGWTDAEWDSFLKNANKIPAVWSANMSIGIAVLRKAIQAFAAVKNFEFRIEEAHHAAKKDAPSGTALTLQSDLESLLGRKLATPKSIREGDIVGEHKVIAEGTSETLCFTHAAHSRAIFAAGAVLAARKIVTLSPGLHTLEQVLGLEK